MTYLRRKAFFTCGFVGISPPPLVSVSKVQSDTPVKAPGTGPWLWVDDGKACRSARVKVPERFIWPDRLNCVEGVGSSSPPQPYSTYRIPMLAIPTSKAPRKRCVWCAMVLLRIGSTWALLVLARQHFSRRVSMALCGAVVYPTALGAADHGRRWP